MKYSTQQVRHFEMCASFRVHAPAGEAPKEAEHQGWEFNFLPMTPHKMVLRRKAEILGGSRVLLFNGLEVHRELYPEDHASGCQAVVIQPAFLDSLLASYGIESQEVIFDWVASENDPVLLSRLETIMAFRDLKDASHVSFDAILTELVLHVLLQYQHSHKAQLLELQRMARFPGAVAKARRTIAAHAFDEDFGLDQLASSVGMSKFHLIESFRRVTGMTPIRYRNLIRIDEAKRLLAISPHAISEVAAILGYRDLSTFNKFFKKSMGLSPSSYRSSKHGEEPQ